jgi:hypothetical protein
MARDFGLTNVAPYASAPAVGAAGATYFNTTSKILFLSDGTAWVTPPGGAPSGAASGSLAGSYPGPSIAASAVRGTPSAGGTAREIAKASIWGADDLIDASVSDAKIAALAATKLTGTVAQARLPVAPSGIATTNVNDGAITLAKLAGGAAVVNTATAISETGGTAGTSYGVTVQTTIAARGGLHVIFFDAAGFAAPPTTAVQQLRLKVTVDGVDAGSYTPVYITGVNWNFNWNASGVRLASVAGQATRTVALQWVRLVGDASWTHVFSCITVVALA